MDLAHKNIKTPPGQVVNHPKCSAAQNGGCYCDGSCMRAPKNIQQERLLKDYILRKQESDSFFKD